MGNPQQSEVVVVGAGLAGLVAAAELAARGHRVSVLDAEPIQSLGGQAHWSLGGLFLVDTPEQRRLGVRDSAELAWQDWAGSAAWDRPEDYWPRRWAESFVAFAAGEARSWLHDLGIRFFPVVQWAERGGYAAPGHGNSVPRFHVVWGTGPGVVEPFARQVLDSDRVTLLPRHRVTGLEAGPDGVRVSGEVLAPSSADRGAPSSREVVDRFSLQARAVVLAAGGIGGNHDLVRRYWPGGPDAAPRRLLSGVPAHVDGSIWAVAERAGARLINTDRMWHYPEGVLDHSPVWPAHGIRVLAGPSALWLDAYGRRLPTPLFPGFDALGTVSHLAGAGHTHSWMVLDQRTLDAEFALSGSEQNGDLTGKDLVRLAQRLRPGPTPEVAAFQQRGVDFLRASSVDELAAAMNALIAADPDPGTPDAAIDADALAATIGLRDAQVRSGLGKDPQIAAVVAARHFLGDRLIRTAPLHPYLDSGGRRAGRGGPLVAVRLHLLTRKTLGGLETDLGGRVLGHDENPLPGVYAAGEVAGFGGGGLHGYRALEGTFLGGCLFGGRVVGRSVADDLA